MFLEKGGEDEVMVEKRGVLEDREHVQTSRTLCRTPQVLKSLQKCVHKKEARMHFFP